MTNNDINALADTTRALIEATERRLARAAQMPIIMPTTPPDTSRNGRRIPRSVKHRAYR